MKFAPGATLASVCLSMISYAEAQPTLDQHVIPGYQVPSSVSAGTGPTFQPNTAAGTPNQTTLVCGATSVLALAAGAATQFVLLKAPSTNTAAMWLNFAGVPAVAASPAYDLGSSASLVLSAAGGFLPTSQINCISSYSASLTLIYK